MRRKRGVAKSTFCVPCWDCARGKRYKNRGFALSGRAHGLIFEVHCDARGANFLHFCKNCPKFFGAKNAISRKIRKSGFCVPKREREICENVARNGFRNLRGSASANSG